MKNNIIVKRFEELIVSSSEVKISKPNSLGYTFVDLPSWQKWATNALNILIRVFGKHSPHYENFFNIYNSFQGYPTEFDEAKGIFLAAKEDYDGGYLFDLTTSISGEILGNFVALAKEALKDGYHNVAAVLASAALEDSLKQYANRNDLDVNEKAMQEVVAALKSKGLVGGAQKGLLDTMPKLRDYAMHANWEKIKPEDVSSIIGFVEQFLLSNF